MPMFEVCLDVRGYAWTDVEAESEQEAEQYARDTLRYLEIQSLEITDVEVKRYADA